MKDSSGPLFETIEDNEYREVIRNTQTGETYTIDKKEEEALLAEIGAKGDRLEETLNLIFEYYRSKEK